MLRFVYDNDVLEHLHSKPYVKYIPKLVNSLNCKKNICYISELNFHELIKGVNDKNFTRLQEIIRKSYDLSGKGNVLLNPYDHVINSCKKTDELYKKHLARNVINKFKAFSNLKSFREFEKYFSSMKENFEKEIDQKYNIINRDYIEMKKIIDDNKNEIPNIKEYLNPKTPLPFFENFKGMLLRKFDLETLFGHLTIEELSLKVPSLRLYSDLMQVMLRQTIFNNKKFKKNDLFDYEKIFYLDYCDYIITDDGPYRSLYNESGNDKLIKRVISLDQFLFHLENKNLIARSHILDERINVYEVN